MKVLVSGAHGFLGSHFVAYLTKKKIPYIPYDRRHPGKTPLSFTHAVHFGGLTPHSKVGERATRADYMRANAVGTKQFLTVLARNPSLKVFVNIGTAAERSRTPYGISKRAQSRLAAAFARTYRVKTFNLRIFNVAGIPAHGSLFRNLKKQFSRKRTQQIKISNAASVRDFVDLDDVVDAVFRALTSSKGKSYEVIDIASGRGVTLKQVVRLFELRTGRRVSLINTASRADRSVGNPRKAQRILDWKAKTPLERSVTKMVP